MRGGKSCRLRWKNYLRPNIKRGGMSQEEEDLIIRMHKLLGNRWSLIAGRLPGRTDNEVKNYWNTHLNKRCPRGKRKHSNSNDNKNDSNSSETKNKEEKIDDPHQNLTECPKNTTEGVEEKKEDESIALNPLAGDTNRFNYDIDSPIMTPANCSMFVFDAEPLTTYMDSFLLFEAFGYTAGEENYAEIGQQHIVLFPAVAPCAFFLQC
ncbi:hypothetical protein TIFTF001_029046 [Ficus carica]|uniref:Uncharacterized protein n=1 Tax=Ficus carica TaxID=3494 RepID=A0AA88DRP7_FICCA|nr:hypothetical protein TIFTF001_029046 [Ficus carica]